MRNDFALALAAPIVGLGLAYVLPRRRRPPTTQGPATRTTPPVAMQRSDDGDLLFAHPSTSLPPTAEPTRTPDVYRLTNPCDMSTWPALVTVGRVGDDEVLIDITRIGIGALTGDAEGARRTLASVWSELRWPSEAHELEVIGVGDHHLPGLRTLPWAHAITMLERGSERTRPLVVLAVGAPSGDDAVRLAAAARPDRNVGVLLAGEWECAWQLRHHGDHARLRPLGVDLSVVGEAASAAATVAEPAAMGDGVLVSMLGPVAVLGRDLSAKETELVAFLATRPAGATEAQIRTALWPDRDAPRGTFNNLVCATRRHLGSTPDGERLLPRVEDGRYRLHSTLTSDLQQLDDTVQKCSESGGWVDVIDRLLSLRGRPFDGWTGGDWPFDDAITSRAEVVIARAAQLVANVSHERVADALVKALDAVQDPAIEDALRDRIALRN